MASAPPVGAGPCGRIGWRETRAEVYQPKPEIFSIVKRRGKRGLSVSPARSPGVRPVQRRGETSAEGQRLDNFLCRSVKKASRAA